MPALAPIAAQRLTKTLFPLQAVDTSVRAAFTLPPLPYPMVSDSVPARARSERGRWRRVDKPALPPQRWHVPAAPSTLPPCRTFLPVQDALEKKGMGKVRQGPCVA